VSNAYCRSLENSPYALWITLLPPLAVLFEHGLRTVRIVDLVPLYIKVYPGELINVAGDICCLTTVYIYLSNPSHEVKSVIIQQMK